MFTNKKLYSVERHQKIQDGVSVEDEIRVWKKEGGYYDHLSFDTPDLKKIIDLLQEKYEEINK